MSEHELFLTLAFALVALLYSSVGHAGASGYIAVMALAEIAPAQMKPVALIMNTAVAAIGTYMLSVTTDPAQAVATIKGGIMLTAIGKGLVPNVRILY